MHNKSAIHVFGEVLFDHFPDGTRVLGGAPFNVAWHLQAFGAAPDFISRIGLDPSGHEIAALMEGWGMSRDRLQIDHEHATGSVTVNIHDGEPHYDIVADCAYDFIQPPVSDTACTQGMLYHGSLALRNPVSSAALKAIKSHHLGKIFVDINLRPPWCTAETISPLLRDADWIKLNEAELTQLCPGKPNLESAMQSVSEQFNLEALFVTLGDQGAVAYTRDGDLITVKPSTQVQVVDTVGAGDAFAAILLLGLHESWPLATTLQRAQAFAGTIVGNRGATVHDMLFYQTFITEWF